MTREKVESVLRPSVSEDEGYTPQHDEASIVLDANESPYDLPSKIQKKVKESLSEISFNRYPGSYSRGLRTEVAQYFDIDKERIVAGNGSDELIGYLLLSCIQPGDSVLVTEPSFSMYEILAKQYHAEVLSVSLDEDWGLPDKFIQKSKKAKISFLGSPNNPTGNTFKPDKIEALLDVSAGLVVIDEAYIEFGGKSLMNKIEDDKNLVVLRTMSKAFGLASARIGFLSGPKSIVNGVNTVRLPYNLNQLSQTTGEIVLNNRDELEDRFNTIRREREELSKYLSENGFSPCPSEANFILFKPEEPDELYEYLLANDIRIRRFSEGRISQYLRVTVGRPEENHKFRGVLDEYRLS